MRSFPSICAWSLENIPKCQSEWNAIIPNSSSFPAITIIIPITMITIIHGEHHSKFAVPPLSKQLDAINNIRFFSSCYCLFHFQCAFVVHTKFIFSSLIVIRSWSVDNRFKSALMKFTPHSLVRLIVFGFLSVYVNNIYCLSLFIFSNGILWIFLIFVLLPLLLSSNIKHFKSFINSNNNNEICNRG